MEGIGLFLLWESTSSSKGGGGVGVGVGEREKIVELAGVKMFVVEEGLGLGLGEEVVVAGTEDAVAWEFVGDALGGDGGVELHDTTVGCHHFDVHFFKPSSEPSKHAIPHPSLLSQIQLSYTIPAFSRRPLPTSTCFKDDDENLWDY